MKEVTNSRQTQSVPKTKNYGQTTSGIETPKRFNNEDGETNASDTDIRENET